MGFRKTKILCTLGPATRGFSDITRLIRVGMDAVRLNVSHGSQKDHLKLIRNVRKASKKTGKALAIVLDLQGARIRIGKLNTPTIELRQASKLTLTTESVIGDERRVSITYKGLTRDIRPGNRILIDDGRIDLKVIRVRKREIDCRIMRGGTLSENKGINLPGVRVRVPVLTQKDMLDLKFALDHDVDYIALSFVRSGKDVEHLKRILQKHRRDIPVIAKIERGEAVGNLESIIRSSDAVMVARGDLGVELAPEQVPMLQKKIVEHCNRHAKPVIIATQMLESMIENPRPTRAEASDVANAVLDGADAVMLSGETSIGKFPIEAVTIMDKIIRKAEEEGTPHYHVPETLELEDRSVITAIGQGACLLAEKMNAAAILTLTHSGATARAIARYRPKAKILGMTDQHKVINRLSLLWGTRGIYLKRLADTDSTFEIVRNLALRFKEVKRGDCVVTTAGIPLLKRGTTNMMKVEKI